MQILINRKKITASFEAVIYEDLSFNFNLCTGNDIFNNTGVK